MASLPRYCFEFRGAPRCSVLEAATCSRACMLAMDNAAIVRRAIEAIWNRGDLAVADELFGSDYVNHDGLIPDLVHGPEAIKISVALYRVAFPLLHIIVESLNTDGDMVVVHWKARTETAVPSGGAATTARTQLTGITRSRLVDGKIVESWTDWDRPDLLRELGIVPRR